MTYKLWGRAGWGSTIVEAQLVWYGLPFTFEPVERSVQDARRARQAGEGQSARPGADARDARRQRDERECRDHAAAGRHHRQGLAGAAGRCAGSAPKFLRWLVFIVANIYPTFTYADDPARFVSVNAARDPFRAATDAYAQRLWQQIERRGRQPVVPGRALLRARHLRSAS